MDRFVNKVIEGDCLEVLPGFPEKSIDMVLCDLPYGITQNSWDVPIDLERLWVQYKRIIKPKGVIALTGQGIFTGRLIMSNVEWFKYKIVWIKSTAVNFLNAQKQPLRRHEDVCIFYKNQPLFQPQKKRAKPYDKGFRKGNKTSNYGNFNGFYIQNISGERYPDDVFYSEEEIIDWVRINNAAQTDGAFHSTQKPVSLGRWMIRTYTTPDAIVLDNACGSGSFLVAAIMENRKYIGIEKNRKAYYMGKPVDFVATCKRRIARALEQSKQLSLFQ